MRTTTSQKQIRLRSGAIFCPSTVRTLLFLPRNAKSCFPTFSPHPPKHELIRSAAVTPQASAWLNRRPSKPTPQPSFNLSGGAPPIGAPRASFPITNKNSGNDEKPAELAFVLISSQPNSKTMFFCLITCLQHLGLVSRSCATRRRTDTPQTPLRYFTNESQTRHKRVMVNPTSKYMFLIWKRIIHL